MSNFGPSRTPTITDRVLQLRADRDEARFVAHHAQREAEHATAAAARYRALLTDLLDDTFLNEGLRSAIRTVLEDTTP